MISRAFSTTSIAESCGRVRVHVSCKADRAEGLLRLWDTYTSLITFREKLTLARTKRPCYRRTSLDTRNKGKKETQLYNSTTVCLGLGGRKKHTCITDKLIRQVQTLMGGAAAPSAPTLPSAEPNPASGDDTVGESPPQRRVSAPRPSPVPGRDPARADGSAGHSEVSASCPPRTSARLMALATRLRRWSHQWTTRPGFGQRSFLPSSQLCLCPY
jgi:hypothetical protein